jgi:hypothetical protein
MKFKKIKNKENYLKKNYPFANVPQLTDKKFCIHCEENFIVNDYKILIFNNEEYIVCPNSPKCEGTVIDWFNYFSN